MSDHTEEHNDHDLGYILDEDAATSSISVMAGLLIMIALLSVIVVAVLLFMGHSQNVAPDASIISSAIQLIA